jgi:hypothetical protein
VQKSCSRQKIIVFFKRYVDIVLCSLSCEFSLNAIYYEAFFFHFYAQLISNQIMNILLPINISYVGV